MAKKMDRSNKTPQSSDVVLSVGEANFGEEDYWNEKWDGINVPASAIAPFKQLDKALTATNVIGRMLLRNSTHKEDAETNDGVRYIPLEPHQAFGLEIAFDLLVDEAENALDRARIACGGPR